jgi:hypothetical protein
MRLSARPLVGYFKSNNLVSSLSTLQRRCYDQIAYANQWIYTYMGPRNPIGHFEHNMGACLGSVVISMPEHLQMSHSLTRRLLSGADS